MQKIFKWIGIVLDSLNTGFAFFSVGKASLKKTYDFLPPNITIPSDEESIEFGKYQTQIPARG